MRRLRSLFLTGTLCVLALSACPAIAQVTNVPWDATLGQFGDTANWAHPFGEALPDANFDEVAVIGNGGTAFVDGVPEASPAGVIINADSTLEIRDGGELAVVVGIEATGNTAVNDGRLVGLSGGTFTSESLNSGGAGTIDLSGTASVTINGASQLDGTTRIAGPDVNFSTASLNHSGTIAASLTGPTHSAIQVGGEAMLGGTLAVNFSDITPAFGDTWDIVDAQSITGNFENVTTNVSPGPGLIFTSQIVDGGNGQIAQAALVTRLTLQINRRTGQVQIRNLAGLEAATIDGYLLGSPSGAFDPEAWSRIGMENWVPSAGSSTHVGEVSLSGQREIGASEDIDLGNLYANPARSAEFGVDTNDTTFEYSLENGEILTGVVDYTDAHNNLVLVVDPDSGDTWIQNQSIFDLEIDGYEIESVSGSLTPSEWESLASSDDSWTEANPAANHIGELSLAGSQALAGESDAISLGQIFTPGAERDLLFTFHAAVGADGVGMPFTGIVEYGEGPIDFGGSGPGLMGDYNGNGQVEQGDLDLVLLNWGQAGVPADWTNNLPEGNIDQAELDGVLLNWGDTAALGTAAAVPEPAGCILALVCLSLAAVCRARRRRV